MKSDKDAARGAAEKGCALGSGDACRILGQIVERQGTQAWPTAVGDYRKSCDAGDAFGCGEYGRMLALGRGVPADPASGRSFLERACKIPDPHACTVLAKSLNDESPGHPRALAVATASCDGGYPLACYTAGQIAPNRATEFNRRACELRDAASCTLAAFDLLEQKNPTGARPLFTQACSLGSDDACESFAEFLLGGKLYARDEQEALRIAKIGCDAGGAKSCGLIKSFSAFADPSRPFTTSVAGFAFGISSAEARRRCTRAHGTWLPVNSDWVCTVQPIKTFADEAVIDLTFCDGRLCEVMAMDGHGEDHAAEALAKLVDKYGEPGASEGPGSVAIHRAACDAGDKRELVRTWLFRPPNRGDMIGRLVFAVSCGNEAFNVIYQDATGLQHRVRDYDREKANY